MKKIIIILAAVLVAGGALYFFASSIRKKSADAPVSGGAPEDFIMGVMDSKTRRLSDFLGQYTVVLVFLDNGRSSDKFDRLFNEKFSGIFSGKKGLLWFNIRKDGRHAIIEEKTGSLALRYRSLYSDLPSYYNFNTLPSALLIDKSGTIKLVYNGYSPTMLADIRAGLPEQAK